MELSTQLASRAYASAQKTAPKGDGPAEALHATAQSFSETLFEAEQTAAAALTGKADAHALVEALAQTELAVEAAVTVRDKVVEAYQEILRMPV